MYQKIILVGNLGGDTEIKYMPDSTAVCNLSLAVSQRVKVGDGWENKTMWARVSMFGKRAETANQYLSKGTKVLVEGALSFDHATGNPRTFPRKDGTTGASFEIVASDFSFVGSKGDNAADGQTPTPYQKQTPQQVMDRMVAGETIAEDDIPF